MSLEFEQLTAAVAEMAREAGRRRDQQREELLNALQLLRAHAQSWEEIEQKMDWAAYNADEKHYRSARPLHQDLPMDRGIAPEEPLSRATIIATDGSQIVPDRHAPFLYYLINVGSFTYAHGSGEPPQAESVPTLQFPRGAGADVEDAFHINSGLVNLQRDQQEIETLARKVAESASGPGPILAILDQRLLYWPIGSNIGALGDRVVLAWQASMRQMNDNGAWLAGFIDRPGKRSVLTMLHTMDLENSGRELSDLYRFDSDLFAGLTDTDLFDHILEPGRRSVVFVDVSQHNNTFKARDPDNEICFFYLKTGSAEGNLARIDIPMWVARDKGAVGQVHALLVDQCAILGSYPYVITRADEIAVVGRRDQEELENRIALQLAGLDIHPSPTGKQQSKNFARGGKIRYEG